MKDNKFIKTAMWILCLLPIAIAAIGMGMLPDSVPMHYDAAGVVDRWGEPKEYLFVGILFSVCGLIMTGIAKSEKAKGIASETEKERVGKESNYRVILTINAFLMLMFNILLVYMMYSSSKAAANTPASINASFINKITSGVVGLICIVSGNIIPKTRINSTAGVRTSWSKYNDQTWSESNRYGGLLMIISGLLCLASAFIFPGITSLLVSMLFILMAAGLSVWYSYKVYKRVRAEEEAKKAEENV